MIFLIGELFSFRGKEKKGILGFSFIFSLETNPSPRKITPIYVRFDTVFRPNEPKNRSLLLDFILLRFKLVRILSEKTQNRIVSSVSPRLLGLRRYTLDDESGISRVGITSMPLYAKANPFFSSANWDPVVSGAAAGGFSSSHYPSMAMDNPGMSCFPHYQPGSGSGYAPDMPSSLLPFGDCGGGQIGHFLASDKKGESVGRLIRAGESHEDHHQVSDDGVLGVSPTGKRRQPEAESQWNKKAVEEFQEDPQRGSDQSQKKHKNGQSKETMNKESSQSEEAPKENYIHLLQSRDRNTPTLGLNPFTGFQGTIPNLSTTTNPQFNPLPQTTLESELQNLYQMGFVSNPSTMSSFLPNGRLKPEL